MTDSTGVATNARANKQKLFIIAGLPVLVMIAATLLFRVTQSGDVNLLAMIGTRNMGGLLQPAVELSKLPLQDVAGAATTWPASTHWSIVVPAFDGCDTNCLQNLMATRQVHLALGREESRVRRVLLLIDAPLSMQAADEIKKNHPHILVVQTRRDVIDGLLAAQPKYMAATASWYLADPQGWLMMHYDAQNTGKDLLTDLKHLLKYSSEK